MRAAHSRLRPDGQCASLAGSQGLFREEGLQGSVAADSRGDWCVQQVACKEDRAFSRDLLKRKVATGEQVGNLARKAARRSFGRPARVATRSDHVGARLHRRAEVELVRAGLSPTMTERIVAPGYLPWKRGGRHLRRQVTVGGKV